MRVIDAYNVNEAFATAVQWMLDDDVPDAVPSRGGNVVEFGPVTTLFHNPCQRVLWDEARDCNPFFHLFESLWMLGGRNDVAFLTQYNKKMADFSDDDTVFHGAYGFRWRHWFGFDQLNILVDELRANPGTRRAMLTMWSPNGDLVCADGGAGGSGSKDLPCNLMVKFEIRSGLLNMIVFNRSNDMLWGAYGANAVHFSMLQEYMAGRLGVRVGKYWQVSANFHVYTQIWDDLRMRSGAPGNMGQTDRYATGEATVFPLVKDPLTIDEEIEDFLHDMRCDENPFLRYVAGPLDEVWDMWRNKDRARAHVQVMKLDQTIDWVLACRLWMERRIVK